MDFDSILYEKKDGIAYITFNRPKVLNALNNKTIEELRQALVDARDDASIRVLILTGTGEKAFVADADLTRPPHRPPLYPKETSLSYHGPAPPPDTIGTRSC